MRIKQLAKALVLWALLFILYLLFAVSLDRSELAAGAVFAAFVALPFFCLRRNFDVLLHLNPTWFHLIWKIPRAMFQESWLLCLALVRKLCGRSSSGSFIEWRQEAGDERYAEARRVFSTFGVCITPNSYLVYLDSDRRVALVRQLVGKKISRLDRDFLELP